ncbi:MAG: BhlA/UviB family holin-like peptide [Chloroflexota bacterium]
MEQEVVKLAVSQGIWATLFVSLLFYVLRESAAREKRLTETLNKVTDQLLPVVPEVRAMRQDLDRLQGEVHDAIAVRR